MSAETPSVEIKEVIGEKFSEVKYYKSMLAKGGKLIAEFPGSGKYPSRTYKVIQTSEGHLYCSCASWTFQKINPKERECKHTRQIKSKEISIGALKHVLSVDLDEKKSRIYGEFESDAERLDMLKKKRPAIDAETGEEVKGARIMCRPEPKKEEIKSEPLITTTGWGRKK